ncbi:MAG: DUF333 domain-containing protein [Candidatus Pacebacteria bacterium]|nr:DUF333 domain-containing protein [Candidatus Paceibacterota bacterium]
MKKKKVPYIILAIAIFLAICASVFINTYKGSINLNGFSISNPASDNCINNGGKLEIKKRGDGGEYGVCFLEDNRQCEEWSLVKGECPKAGVKVTGYITEAAVYCAVLGGEYKISDESNTETENGTCSFFNGNVCNVWDLYNGKCEKGVIDFTVYNNSKFNFSLKFPNSWKDNYEVKESQDKDTTSLTFSKSGIDAFKIIVIPESLWKIDSRKLEYIGRYEDNLFILVPLQENDLSGEIERIKKTFTITKPYIFSEESKENGANYTVEVKYPYLGAVDDMKVNVDINNFIGNIITNFKEQVSKPDAWKGSNTLKIFYDPYEINKGYISLRFEVAEYTGGARPLITSYSFNYDLKNRKILNLSDIFDSSKNYIQMISDKSIQYLLKLNETESFSDKEWIEEGASPIKQNYKIFTFNKDAIVFYFDEYQVAPYSSGRQQVIIPFSEIKNLLNAEFISNYID